MTPKRKAFDRYCESWQCGCTDCGAAPVHEKACIKIFAAGAAWQREEDAEMAEPVDDVLAGMIRAQGKPSADNGALSESRKEESDGEEEGKDEEEGEQG